MSGQLVIAELRAFRGILDHADRSAGDAVRTWGRSVITNALHRLGPVPALNEAAHRASSAANDLAAALDEAGCSAAAVEARRDAALRAVDALIATVCEVKTQPGDPLV